MPHHNTTTTSDLLCQRIAEAATPAAGVTVFEVEFWRLPAFDSPALLEAAATVYAAAGRQRPAELLHDFARQPGNAPVYDTLPKTVADILTHARPATELLHRLVRCEAAQDIAGGVALFEGAMPYLPPIDEYWMYYRVALLYEQLGRSDAAFLLASMAWQMEPAVRTSHRMAQLIIARLLRRRAWGQAAVLHARWSALHDDLPLLAPQALAELAAKVSPESSPTVGRRERVVVPADERPPVRLRMVGRALPHALESLLRRETRPAITVAELVDVELLVADGAVSVWTTDGVPQPDLSVGMSPSLMRDLIYRRAQEGETIVERTLERALLLGDKFSKPDLSHFLLDQATRLAVYRLADLKLDEYVAVGPDLVRPYQREIASRLGARSYMGTSGLGRVQVSRLAVSSNCHALCHAAHLGADWALGSIRAAFVDITAGVSRPLRLLVSHTDAAERRLIDEDAVLALLQPHGFTRIIPSLLPLAEQVSAFAAATHVVAVHGAALAHLAFCRPGTNVLEIFHPHYGTYAYAQMAATLGLDYAVMVGFDGISDAPDDNDPALAADRAETSFNRDVRADLRSLTEWLATAVDGNSQA